MIRRISLIALAATVVATAIAVTTVRSDADTTPRAVAPLTVNTDAAFNALNDALLVSNGDQRYYKESLTVGEKDYFWRQALAIQTAEDVYESSRNPATSELIGRLLDTFLQQNQGPGGLYDWNWNEFNDDVLWAGLAFIRGYKITGNRTYLNQAQYAFNRVYDRGWDGALGGGIWWSIDKEDKNALSNSPAVILGVLIYESTNDRGYLDKAQAIYDWVWLTLLDRSSGAVHETITANGELSSGQTVYSAGAFVGAAQALYRNNGRQSIFDDAKRTTDWVIRAKTVNGLLTDGRRDGTWQSEFARGMGEFVRENNLWAEYYDWMKRNADAAWSVRRADLNLSWNRWDAQTPRDSITTTEAIGAVVMQAVTPASRPDGTTNAVLSNFNDKCIDVPRFNYSDGQPLGTWTCTNGENQRWEFAGGALRTRNNLCMDVAGGSTENEAVIQIATCSGSPAQQFTLTAAGDLVNPQANKCVDIKGWNTANSAELILWDCSGATNQKWRRG